METLVIINTVVLIIVAVKAFTKKEEQPGIELNEALKDSPVADYSSATESFMNSSARETIARGGIVPMGCGQSQRTYPTWKGHELITKKDFAELQTQFANFLKIYHDYREKNLKTINLLAEATGYEFQDAKRDVKDTPAKFVKIKKTNK
jgi:hypothetical protein